jgi:hypothetical protein
MPIIYPDAPRLERHPKVGNKDCVALVKEFTILKNVSTSRWREGEPVLDNRHIAAGTVIATFVRGRYPNRSAGNHAAFYLRPGPGGFWVIDQWKSDRDKPNITARWIPSRGAKKRDGTYPLASDNAQAFSIVEINGAKQ